MGKERNPEQCRKYLDAINAGEKQKEACKIAGWSESAGSRYLKHVRENEPWLLQVNTDTPKEETQSRESEVTPVDAPGGDDIRVSYVQPEPEKKKIVSFNITGYWDYVQTMAGHSRMSVTGYIRGLIAADMEMNRERYEKLKNI